jgi:hypothetical protein
LGYYFKWKQNEGREAASTSAALKAALIRLMTICSFLKNQSKLVERYVKMSTSLIYSFKSSKNSALL